MLSRIILAFIKFIAAFYVIVVAMLAASVLLNLPIALLQFAVNVRDHAMAPAFLFALIRSVRRPISNWSPAALLILLAIPWEIYRTPAYCSQPPLASTFSISTMTVNLAGSASITARNLSRVLNTYDVDVIALQEVSPRFWKSEAPLLKRSHRHFIYRPSPDGYWTQALLSRHPIEAATFRDPGPGFTGIDARVAIEATIQLKGRQIVILVAHLSVPFRRGPCRGLICMLSRYDPQARNGQLRRLQSWAAETGAPSIVLGDLNLAEADPEYRRFAAPFVDAGRCLKGNRSTWPSNELLPFPVVRIDYALLRPGPPGRAAWTAHAHTFAVDGSDHLALVAEFRATPKSSAE